MIYPGQPRIDSADTLAAFLREQIMSGAIPPDRRIPSEKALSQTYGLARGTVAKAVHKLRQEGLVDYIRGYGVVVRVPRPLEDVYLESGSTVQTRPPSADERELFDISEGVSVFVVTHPDGSGDLYPGDRYRLRVG